MRHIVFGAGAIGGLVSARLHESGHDVVAVARGAHYEAMRAAGLRVETADGTSETVRFPVVDDAEAISFRDGDDVVLLCVKSQDTAVALSRLSTSVSAATPIVCLQNGVANEPSALRYFSDVYGAYVFCPVTFVQPGVITAERSPVHGIIDTGRYPAGVAGVAGVAGFVTEALAASRFSARTIDDVMRWKYAKLIGNLGNVVQAICAPGDGTEELVGLARDEGLAVLAAAGIDIASKQEQADRIAGLFGRTGGGRSGGSTWQSFARGAGSIETDYLNGEIVLLGRMHGIATPVNALLQRAAATQIRAGAAPASLSAGDLLRQAT